MLFSPILILSVVNVDRYNLLKQKLFVALTNFSECDGVLRLKTFRPSELLYRGK